MSQIEPGDREEMLLQGILNGDTETNIEPGSRKEMLLKAILESGGGSSLPEVTSEDNGKVLKVEDGEWGKGTAMTVVNVAEGELGSTNVKLDIDYDTFIEMLKTSPVSLYYGLGVTQQYYPILSYDDTAHNITLISNHADFDGKHVLEYNVEPDFGDNTKTQLSIVGFLTDTVYIELSGTSQTLLMTSFQAFMMQAVQNAGSFVHYRNANGIAEAASITQLLRSGVIVEFDVLTATVRPSVYPNTGTSSTQVFGHLTIPTYNINASLTVSGWCDVVFSTSVIDIIGTFITV